jgi:hypothetical protein
LLAQDAVRAELLTRTKQGWLVQDIEGQDAELNLPALGISLPLAELYDGIALPAPPPAAA